jgi:O-antigen/teichoic acid export membrane protein
MSGGSLRRGFSWTLAGNAAFAASQWAMIVILAKIGTADQLGHFALAMAIATPVFLFANLNLRAAQATDMAARYSFEDYLVTRLTTSAIAWVATVLIALSLSASREAITAAAAIGLLKCVDSLHDVFYGNLQQRENMRAIARSLIARGAVSLVLFALVLRTTGSLPLAILALTIAWLAVLAAVDVREKVKLEAFARLPRTFGNKHLVRMALPLGIVAVLDSLNINLPKYVLQLTHGAAAVGHFTALAVLIMTGGVVLSALGNVAMPRLALHAERGEIASVRRIFRALLILAVLPSVLLLPVVFLWGEQLLTLIYNAEIARHVKAFQVLMVAAAIWYATTMMGFLLLALREFQGQVWMYLAMNITTALVCAVAIPAYGVLGGFIAFTSGILLRTCWSAYLVREQLRTRERAIHQGAFVPQT